MKAVIQVLSDIIHARHDFVESRVCASDAGCFLAAIFHLGEELVSERVIIHPLGSKDSERLLRVCSFLPFEIPRNVDGYKLCQQLTSRLKFGSFLYQPTREHQIEYVNQQCTSSSLLNQSVVNRLIDEALGAEILAGCTLERHASLTKTGDLLANAIEEANLSLN